MIQGTASEAVIVAILAAKSRILKKHATTEELKDGEKLAQLTSKLTVYFSDQVRIIQHY